MSCTLFFFMAGRIAKNRINLPEYSRCHFTNDNRDWGGSNRWVSRGNKFSFTSLVIHLFNIHSKNSYWMFTLSSLCCRLRKRADYEPARATITKYHIPNVINSRNEVLHFLGAEVWRQGISRFDIFRGLWGTFYSTSSPHALLPVTSPLEIHLDKYFGMSTICQARVVEKWKIFESKN